MLRFKWVLRGSHGVRPAGGKGGKVDPSLGVCWEVLLHTPRAGPCWARWWWTKSQRQNQRVWEELWTGCGSGTGGWKRRDLTTDRSGLVGREGESSSISRFARMSLRSHSSEAPTGCVCVCVCVCMRQRERIRYWCSDVLMASQILKGRHCQCCFVDKKGV